MELSFVSSLCKSTEFIRVFRKLYAVWFEKLMGPQASDDGFARSKDG